MKIAIIAAMEEEVALLRSKITDCQINTLLDFNYYTGKIAECDVVLLQSGIGKVAAATSTALLLNRFQVDAVINTGSAGGLDKRLNIGDVVVSSYAIYHDANLTAFGYPLGQMAGAPAHFMADPMLNELAKKVITNHKINAVEGAIASGDSFINSEEKLHEIKQHFPDVIAVEMEAAAIAHVCSLFKLPFVVVRAISDNGDKSSAISFDQFLPLAAKQSSLIVEAMLTHLQQPK